MMSVAISPDAKLIAAGSVDGHVRLWRTRDGALRQIFRGSGEKVASVAFSPDGKWLAAGFCAQKDKQYYHSCVQGAVWIWRVGDGEIVYKLQGHKDEVTALSFSPDSRWLASASADKTVRVWELSDDEGRLALTLDGPTAIITSVAFAPQGNALAAGTCAWGALEPNIWGCLQGEIWIWSFPRPDSPRIIKQGALVQAVAFAPQGELFASGGRDNLVSLWRYPQRDFVQALSGHTNWITSIAFAPNGELLATASQDKTLRLWDIRTTTSLRTLEGHTSDVTGVIFSPDQRLLVSVSEDGTVRIWGVPEQNSTP